MDKTGRGLMVASTVGSPGGATDTGMNVVKLLRAKRFLEERDIGIGQKTIILAMNAQGIREINSDITDLIPPRRSEVKVFVDGERVLKIAGVIIVQCEWLPDIDAAHFGFVMWSVLDMRSGGLDALRIGGAENVIISSKK